MPLPSTEMEFLPSRAGNHPVSAAAARSQAEGEDRISPLPDDILLLILQKLGGTREAIRTCSVLSWRWRRLPWLLPEPRISVKKFIVPRGVKLWKLDDGELDRAADPFCRAASRFLAISGGVTRCLSLKFPLTTAFTSAVHRLLSDAVGDGRRGGKVNALRFDIRAASDGLEYDSDEARTERVRCLRAFAVDSPRVLGVLTKLELRHLRLSSADVAVVLGACTRLEHLAMYDCDAGVPGEALVIDVVPGSSSALRELELECCYYGRVVLRRVPKLARLTVDTWSSAVAGVPLSLGSIPSLDNLSLIYCAESRTRRFKLSKLLAKARSISQLSLHFENGEKVWIQLEDPRSLLGAFSKLTVLNLGGILAQCDLSWTIFFLQAAPFLQKFNLSIQKHVCSAHVTQQEMPYCETTYSEFKHKRLKSLKIAGFEVEEKYIKFVRMVLELAMALQAVTLTDEESCKYCYHVEERPASTGSRYPKDDSEKSSIVKQLKDGITLKVQIFIV